MNMYETTDMYLAGYLIARGHALDSFERLNGRTTFRISGEDDGLNQLIQEYYADRGLVSGLRLNNSLKNLKNLLYSNLDHYGKHNTHNTGASK